MAEYFIGTKENEFWFSSITINYTNHHLPFIQNVIIKSSVAIGIIFAAIFYFYSKNIADFFANFFKPIYNLFFNKWYIDEIYNTIFTKPYFFLSSFFWKKGDINFIDAYGPNGISKLIKILSRNLSSFQSGYLYHYAFVMLASLVIFLTWYIFN